MNDSQSREARQKQLNALSYRVLGLSMEVHRTLGAGLLESAYEEALAYEFTHENLSFERQTEVPLFYKSARLSCDYRLDFLIEETLVLELKSVSELLPLHHAQLLTYLRLLQQPVGLLINFNVPVLKDGVQRVVCGDLFLKA